jgi:hypothetical protein
MTFNNLNLDVIYSDDDETGWKRLKKRDSKNITVYFDGIEDALIKYISKAHTCLGCIAWLTNDNLLDALSEREIVSIIVNKGDFSKIDVQEVINKNKKEITRANLNFKYSQLPRGVCQSDFSGFGEEISVGECFGLTYEPDEIFSKMREQTGISPDKISCNYPWTTEAIRCLGENYDVKNTSSPLLHHKFLIFCHSPLEPYAVWTGSFNFSFNATRSLENGLYITDECIVKAYWLEYLFNFVRSEPLDWTDKYQYGLEINS